MRSDGTCWPACSQVAPYYLEPSGSGDARTRAASTFSQLYDSWGNMEKSTPGWKMIRREIMAYKASVAMSCICFFSSSTPSRIVRKRGCGKVLHRSMGLRTRIHATGTGALKCADSGPIRSREARIIGLEMTSIHTAQDARREHR